MTHHDRIIILLEIQGQEVIFKEELELIDQEVGLLLCLLLRQSKIEVNS